MPVRLVLNDSLAYSPGTFGARLYHAAALHLPGPVYQLAVSAGVQHDDVDVFFGSVLQHFPGACAQALGGWSAAEYDRAIAELRNLLKDHLSEASLNPRPPPRFATGALLPGSRGGGNER